MCLTTSLKSCSQSAAFMDNHQHKNSKSDNSTPSKDTADSWMSIPGLIETKVEVLDTTFSWWLSPCKKASYKFISSRYINDQKVLQSDWTRGKTSHTQPKLLVSNATFPWWLFPCNVKITIWRHHLILSRDIDEQRILQSDWIRSTLCHSLYKVVVSDATFSWRSSPCKEN